VPEESFEHGPDVFRPPQNPLEPSAAAAEPENDQVSRGRVPDSFAVDDDGGARLEEGVADEELAAAGELGYKNLH
jgi:hypothetical protein